VAPLAALAVLLNVNESEAVAVAIIVAVGGEPELFGDEPEPPPRDDIPGIKSLLDALTVLVAIVETPLPSTTVSTTVWVPAL